ncbi:MAG: lysophospholipid acyltransferase family protein [Armatimonadetes bacterium]|nr:lysophospholipid acyltransferase family protein [Armatimonadota bacterium]MDE2207736.1 lysophospholipid acyltransferase family protein [Armatimonadota bacterium]
MAVTSLEQNDSWRARHALRTRITSAFVVGLVRSLYATYRLRVHRLDELVPSSGGAILLTWHGRTLIPANLLRNRGYWALISLSRDGELQNAIFQRYGFQTVRGSTGRGGIRAAIEVASKLRAGGILTFTPDGPRGPSHKVQHGVIFMAQKSGVPIIPVGISASRRWQLKSWDQYMVPKPFATIWFVVGDPIYVPPVVDDVLRDELARTIEVAINRLERDAELRCGHSTYPSDWRLA